MSTRTEGHDLKRSFGKSVSRLRHEDGFTQEELASRSGLHRSYVADLERGVRNPSLLAIVRLLRALDRSLCVRRIGAKRCEALLEP